MKSTTPETKKFHMSMPETLHKALTVLAELDGMSLSELLAQLGRAELKSRGYALLATGEQIAKELERRSRAGEKKV